MQNRGLERSASLSAVALESEMGVKAGPRVRQLTYRQPSAGQGGQPLVSMAKGPPSENGYSKTDKAAR
jgi:hypothetical protein